MLITEGNPGQASALTGSTVAASNPSGEFRDSLSAQIAGQLSSTQTGRVAPQAAGASGAPASASARAALRGKDGRPANPPDFGNPKCAADLTPAVADSPIGALAMQAIPVPAPVVTQEGQADSDVCANAKTVTEAEVVKTVNIPSLRLPFGSLVPTGQNAKDTKVFSGETPVTEPEAGRVESQACRAGLRGTSCDTACDGSWRNLEVCSRVTTDGASVDGLGWARRWAERGPKNEPAEYGGFSIQCYEGHSGCYRFQLRRRVSASRPP